MMLSHDADCLSFFSFYAHEVTRDHTPTPVHDVARMTKPNSQDENMKLHIVWQARSLPKMKISALVGWYDVVLKNNGIAHRKPASLPASLSERHATFEPQFMSTP